MKKKWIKVGITAVVLLVGLFCVVKWKNINSDTKPKEYAGECTLSVDCKSILNNLERLDKNKRELVPDDGYILKTSTIGFYEGETAFDVLKRVLRQKKIHLEFEKVASYDSVYIEGIGNIYEFDCGKESGWLYRVNGDMPDCSGDKYKIMPGDNVEIVYICSYSEM